MTLGNTGGAAIQCDVMHDSQCSSQAELSSCVTTCADQSGPSLACEFFLHIFELTLFDNTCDCSLDVDVFLGGRFGTIVCAD